MTSQLSDILFISPPAPAAKSEAVEQQHPVSVTSPDPNQMMDTSSAVATLRGFGFPASESTFASPRTRGGGPAYQKYGNRVLYKWADVLEWAVARLSSPRRSSSELETGAEKSKFLSDHGQNHHEGHGNDIGRTTPKIRGAA